MSGRRCNQVWPGPCPRSDAGEGAGHVCARPAGHAGVGMCYCGARAPASAQITGQLELFPVEAVKKQPA